MNFQTDSGVATNADVASQTHRSVTGPQPSATPLGLPSGSDNLAAALSSCSQKTSIVKVAGEGDDVWPRESDDPQSKEARLKQKKAPQPVQSWLAGDPFGWIGKRVRSRKTGAIFTVRNAYRNGRVELEKSWMTYSYAVETIRAEFETYS
jgi:hypothetical protein